MEDSIPRESGDLLPNTDCAFEVLKHLGALGSHTDKVQFLEGVPGYNKDEDTLDCTQRDSCSASKFCPPKLISASKYSF